MDTPGTNDFQNELSDYDIAKMKHCSLNNSFSDPTKGVSCITQCIMIDGGGRLKGTSVDNMANTFHSLTYSHPLYDPRKDGGPMICIIFTKFSKNYDEEDNIMIPGVESSAFSNQEKIFKLLVNKFKKELSKKIYDDLSKIQTLEDIERKIDIILKPECFFTYMIFPGNSIKM